MSKHHHPLNLAIEDSRNPEFYEDIYRKPSQPDFDGYLTYSSSPARSSSPPSTPYSSRRDSDYAYIRSSPDVAVDALYRQRAVDIWGGPPLSSKSLFSSPFASGSSNYDYRYGSGYGLQKDAHSQLLDSDGRRNDVPSDSEEDIEDISRVIGDYSYRTTYFCTSAERGLWRSDPVSLIKPTPSTLQERKSVPTFSRVPTPLPLTTRTVSEPAPSNNSQTTGFYPETENERTAELSDSMVIEPTHFTPSIDSKSEDEISSPHTLPSLITDAEGSEDDVNVELPSSPLPPSSPPLSPLSRSISIISRSSSPLSFPFEGSSSPLSELSDDYDNEGEGFALTSALGMHFIEQAIVPSLKMEDETEVSEHTSGLQTSCRDLAEQEQHLSPSKPQLSCLEDSLAFPLTPVSAISNIRVTTLSREPSTLDSIDSDDTFPSSLGSTVATSSDSLLHIADAEKVDGPDVDMTPNLVVPSSITSTERIEADDDDSRHRLPSRSRATSSALKDKNGVVHRSSNTLQPATSRASSQKATETEQNSEKKKQNNVERDDVKSPDVKSTKAEGKKRVDRDDEENDGSSSVGGSRRKRLKRTDGDVSSRPMKRIPKPRRHTRPPPTYDEDEEPLDSEARDLHATICGLIIETMATSRASSLPASSIFKLVMSSQPYLKSQRSELDWLRIFERVLRDGAADRGSGVFGKVESSGKDASDRPLEAQWFYVPERDQDQERAALIRSMMPRPGKRTETMKYKQYYWRPLEKISKWDPEDAL